jgi:sec-independent protein translocase protein TatB
MFGVSLTEAAFIALVAVVIFGPERVPELARQAGRFLRVARQMATNARDDLRGELGPDYANLELRDLDPRTIVKKQIIAAMEDDEIAAAKEAQSTMAEPPFDPEAT